MHAYKFRAETCKRCGYMSSNELCKACTLLEGLERGMAAAAVVSHSFSLSVSPQTGLALIHFYIDGARAQKTGR